ncbi:hypothetical protein CRENBAI_011523 [Crenichthys baileyi]|uniref:Uncharacterized protein n=1 Tax=Crenichthys baileyi TaxID=28760 RepID=A0AAV9RAT1_9TELE
MDQVDALVRMQRMLVEKQMLWRHRKKLQTDQGVLDWVEARRDFFPDPRTHHAIEAERQRALGEIATSMRRPSAPSSARLSTEVGGGFPAHGLAPDQPSPLLPTPNPVPGPVPEGFMDEPPPHPDPVPGSLPEGFMDEPPPHPDPVPGSVPEWFMDEPHPHPDPVPSSVPEGPKPNQPHTLFLSVRGSWMDYLHFLLHFLVLSWRAPRTHPLCMLCLGGSVADRHCLGEGPSSSAPITWVPAVSAPLSSTVGSPGPAAGRQIIGSYITGRLIIFSYVAGLLIACPCVAGLLIAGSAGGSPLIAGSARDGHRSFRLNSGSARDGHRAVRLNSCPPSEEAPSAHPGRAVLFWFFWSPLVPYVMCMCDLVCWLPCLCPAMDNKDSSYLKTLASGVLPIVLVYQKTKLRHSQAQFQEYRTSKHLQEIKLVYVTICTITISSLRSISHS